MSLLKRVRQDSRVVQCVCSEADWDKSIEVRALRGPVQTQLCLGAQTDAFVHVEGAADLEVCDPTKQSAVSTVLSGPEEELVRNPKSVLRCSPCFCDKVEGLAHGGVKNVSM